MAANARRATLARSPLIEVDVAVAVAVAEAVAEALGLQVEVQAMVQHVHVLELVVEAWVALLRQPQVEMARTDAAAAELEVTRRVWPRLSLVRAARVLTQVWGP